MLFVIPEIIQSNGYPVESHVIQTTDGYLLTSHRIPYGKSPEAGLRRDKPVVILQHGVLSSSADWLIIGPENALPYLLADQGYDVWIGNSRGNTYSRKHITLNPDTSSKFWDFSFHEMALYDLPATIDYILKRTGRKKLSYVGHSQGTSLIFAMLSMLPSYNDLISSAHTLAPAAFMSHSKSPLLSLLANFAETFGVIHGFSENTEFLPSVPFVQKTLQLLCQDGSPTQNICLGFIFQLSGPDYAQLNTTQIPVIVANVPSGVSTKQIIHYVQLYRTGHFRSFDYGPVKNMQKYGSKIPPDYPLERIAAPISLHYSDNDWGIDAEDVIRLSSKIPNLIGAFRVPFAKFNHIDYLVAKDAKSLLYDDLIKLISK
ncbi:lipase 3-like, partial [Lutzomyia longipalpis]|uniref:lipase 3-like n=1 Tax=Lutzomyia longipalpis TaxID=7200 RepID=UPI0024834448